MGISNMMEKALDMSSMMYKSISNFVRRSFTVSMLKGILKKDWKQYFYNLFVDPRVSPYKNKWENKKMSERLNELARLEKLTTEDMKGDLMDWVHKRIKILNEINVGKESEL